MGQLQASHLFGSVCRNPFGIIFCLLAALVTFVGLEPTLSALSQGLPLPRLGYQVIFVTMKGLEPSRLWAADFESAVSTNSTTRPFGEAYIFRFTHHSYVTFVRGFTMPNSRGEGSRTLMGITAH